jgi:hypothetical protein
MLKGILKGWLLYILVLVFIVPIIIFVLLGNASRKQNTNTTASPESNVSQQQNVPLPSKTDVVRTFCDLIDEGKISEAVGMIDTNDDTTKQQWGVTFNNFSSFKLVSIKKSSVDETGNSFEVDINVTLKKNLTDLPIPNYGWDTGLNKRWISVVEKEKDLYKIVGIATGP